jgi:hypothetical protein
VRSALPLLVISFAFLPISANFSAVLFAFAMAAVCISFLAFLAFLASDNIFVAFFFFSISFF